MFAASIVAAAGCNLLTGASDLDFGDGEPITVPPVDPDTGVPVTNPPDGGSTEDSRAPTDARPDSTLIVDSGTDVDSGPVQNAKRVFVTSAKTNGDMKGFLDGDQLCASLAAAQSLGGTWVAWLSIQAVEDAVDRLTFAGPWYLVDQMTVAVTSKTQLLSVTGIAHAIDRDEKGVSVPNDEVWTGTRAGRYYQLDCAGWKNAGFQGGQFGRTNTNGGAWTSSTGGTCGTQRRLYCFEN